MIITAGKYKGRKLYAPDEKITRPTLSKTRMGIFNSLYSIVGDFENKTFLDVFGGSGIMGLEALSRGFSRAKVYEINKKSAEVIKKNYALLGLVPELIVGDSLKLVSNDMEVFDVVYIDPPYDSGVYKDIISAVKGNIIVVESRGDIEYGDLKIIKQKLYGNVFVTYLKVK